MYVFGYGSLMNEKSLQKTILGKKIFCKAMLKGYRRIFDMPKRGKLYLNIIECKKCNVNGVLIHLSRVEFNLLQAREYGYTPINMQHAVYPNIGSPVYVFIGPHAIYPNHTILQSYIDVCTAHLDAYAMKSFFRDSIVNNPITHDI